MIYNLSDKFDFGRYKGWTIYEVISGWEYPTQEFIKYFVQECLFSQQYTFNDGKNDYKMEIVSFDLLINNEIKIKLKCDCANESTIIDNLNTMLIAGESYPEKNYFNSANDIIKMAHSTGNKDFKIFSDISYIEWALNEHNSFFLNSQHLDQLKYLDSHTFGGLVLFKKIEEPNQETNSEEIKQLFAQVMGKTEKEIEEEFVDSLIYHTFILSYEVRCSTSKCSLKYSKDKYQKKLNSKI